MGVVMVRVFVTANIVPAGFMSTPNSCPPTLAALLPIAKLIPASVVVLGINIRLPMMPVAAPNPTEFKLYKPVGGFFAWKLQVTCCENDAALLLLF